MSEFNAVDKASETLLNFRLDLELALQHAYDQGAIDTLESYNVGKSSFFE